MSKVAKALAYLAAFVSLCFAALHLIEGRPDDAHQSVMMSGIWLITAKVADL